MLTGLLAAAGIPALAGVYAAASAGRPLMYDGVPIRYMEPMVLTWTQHEMSNTLGAPRG